MLAPQNDRPFSIAMLALGGQGGGVLTRWLVDLAEENGFLAQSTYVAGVAQRTGATVYCIELYPEESAKKHGRAPVFTPYPVPGDVDLVIAAEMAETGRAIQKGFVTPNTTTLIASSHRVYSITEKQALDNGVLDQAPVAAVAAKAAKRFVCFDMAAAADETNSILSAVVLGAIAATEVLPFERDAYLKVIRDSGRAVERNLAGFAAGFSGAQASTAGEAAEVLPQAIPEGSNGRTLASRIENEIPVAVQATALHGALRALDYQDAAYADSYVDTLAEFCRHEEPRMSKGEDYSLGTEVARQLALQMCYEDIIRVADLKTRLDRTTRVRKQLGATEVQPLHVIEYLHPRIEEICDTLPAGLGRYTLRSPRLLKLISPVFSRGRNIKTSTITGYLIFRTIAKLKRWRRGTYRFTVQCALIESWLEQVRVALESNYDDALRIAQSMEAVRGYGETYERGLTRYKDALD